MKIFEIILCLSLILSCVESPKTPDSPKGPNGPCEQKK